MELGVLDPTKYEPESFDIVCSFEVIEHINNPREELSNFNKLLRPGGLVYCTTPNFNAVERYQLGSDWNVLGCTNISPITPQKRSNVFTRKLDSRLKRFWQQGLVCSH